MEKIKLNRNNYQEEEVVFLAAGDTGRTFDFRSYEDKNSIVLSFPFRHEMNVGESLTLKKKSGLSGEEWGTYGEDSANVTEILNDHELVISYEDKFCRIISAETDTHVITLESPFPYLPEDFEEQTLSATLQMYNTDNIVLERLYPVYRHAFSVNDTYNGDYDRNFINTSCFGLSDEDFAKLPTKTVYRYEMLKEPSQEAINKAIRVDVVDDSIIENPEGYHEYVFSVSCTPEETKTYYKLTDTEIVDIDALSSAYLIMGRNPYYHYEGEYASACTFYNSVEIVREKDFFSIILPLYCDGETNLLQSVTIEEDFAKDIKSKVIPGVIDMEKVPFVPVLTGAESITANELEFNLHFRERDVEYRLVDGTTPEMQAKAVQVSTVPENPTASDLRDKKYVFVINNGVKKYYSLEYKEGWSITPDGGWNNIPVGTARALVPSTVPDVVGLVNFTNEDIQYQRERVKKSFLRLSFYDSIDPLSQKLLYYSTIFLDSGELFGKFARNRAINKYFGVFDQYKGIESNYDNEKYLGLRFSVKDWYNTDKSSEGFYLYLFNSEVSQAEPEKEVYLKVEFNHAGNGRTLVFSKPNYVNGGIAPIPMDDYYEKTFIKLKIKYKEQGDSKYIYLVDENDSAAVIIDSENRKITLNLFEVLLENGNN